MAEATKTQTPRKRPTAQKAPAKATTTKPAATKTPPASEEPAKVAYTLGEAFQETKTYTKFDLKRDADGNDTGMVGTVYAPLGTEIIRIQLVGPPDVVAE